jgi:uncharacterized repeat protein (TIGR02543 family)
VAQPGDQTVTVGTTVLLGVAAGGTPPLSYQWQFNGNPIPGATLGWLGLTNAQFADAGFYSVLVSNLAGTITSSNALVTVNPVPPCLAPPSGLVGWWRGEGNLLDDTGGNTAAAEGALSFATAEVGQGFVFNGDDASIEIPAVSNLDVGLGPGFTIEAWIKPVDLMRRPIVEWNSSTGTPPYGVSFWASQAASAGGGPGCLFANVLDASGQSHLISSAGGLLASNLFQHVALTYDKASGSGTIYLNGAVVAMEALGNFIPQTSYDVYLGARVSGADAALWRGQMDEVGLYSRALSATEIQGLHDAGVSGKCDLPPAILAQPLGREVLAGTDVAFTVKAAGASPLVCQWTFNGTNIIGATNATLSLTNTDLNQSGAYAVVVTNAIGAAASSNALLAVLMVLVYGDGQLLTNSICTATDSVIIQLQGAYTNGYLFYTLDGTVPSYASTLYTGPFTITWNSTLRVLAYSPDFFEAAQSDPITFLIPPKYSLTATAGGGGAISLGSLGPYPSNTLVAITAVPSNGWSFVRWLGDASGTTPTNMIVIDRDMSLQAVFGTTVRTTVAGGGSVFLDPPGGFYPYGTMVQATAVPQLGNCLVFWGNAANGNANPLRLMLTNAAPTISSLFVPLTTGQVALAVAPVGRGSVSISPTANAFSLGQVVSVSAIPDTGNTFLGWSGDAAGAQNPLPISMTQSQTIYANFSSATLTFQLGAGGLNPGFSLFLDGQFGSAYRLDGSTNLLNWTPLLTVTNPIGPTLYTDSNATNFDYRFYRSVPAK